MILTDLLLWARDTKTEPIRNNLTSLASRNSRQVCYHIQSFVQPFTIRNGITPFSYVLISQVPPVATAFTLITTYDCIHIFLYFRQWTHASQTYTQCGQIM